MVVNYSQLVLQSNPLHYFKFSEQKSSDSTVVSEKYKETLNTCSLITGAILSEKNNVGGCFDFARFIKVTGHPNGYITNNSFSVNVWINSNSQVGNLITFDDRLSTNTLNAISFCNDVVLRFSETNETTFGVDLLKLLNKQWNMFTITVDRSSKVAKVYFNGKFESSKPFEIDDSFSIIKSHIRINNTSEWKGFLDELEIHKRVLTDEEIAERYKIAKAFVSPINLCTWKKKDVLKTEANTLLKSGKFYWEVLANDADMNHWAAGISCGSSSVNMDDIENTNVLYRGDGIILVNGVRHAVAPKLQKNDILSCILNTISGHMWFLVNGELINSESDPTRGYKPTVCVSENKEWYPIFYTKRANLDNLAIVNFGQVPFTYSPPYAFCDPIYSHTFWNASDSQCVTFENDNRTVLLNNEREFALTRTEQHLYEGRWYWEITIDNLHPLERFFFGVSNADTPLNKSIMSAVVYGSDSSLLINNVGTGNLNIGYFTTGDIIMFAYDSEDGKLFIGKNGVWSHNKNPVTILDPNSKWKPYLLGVGNSSKITLNFGHNPYIFEPPF